MLPGRATDIGTLTRMAGFPGVAAATLGKTGWRVSQAGFGGYRIDIRIQAHREALAHALRSGINLIDTSSNYADGNSELLIGQVLGKEVAAGRMQRDQVVVVTKAGYIQGRNFTLAQERERQGQAFPEVVKLQDGLWHCLHPEFLADQLQRSRDRLQLETIDVFLLHNPEYFLKSRHDRPEYERRLQEAFRFLETQVEEGTIACYGVSSNTFPEAADQPEFTSLETLLALAAGIRPDHHFRVIQFPANLFESGFALTPNQSGGRTLLELAQAEDLGVLINRPLNAFTGQGMVRLADVEPGRALDPAALQADLRALAETERMLLASGPSNPSLQQCLVIGPMLEANVPHIHGLEHWREVVAYHLVPRLEASIQLLGRHPAMAGYREHVLRLFEALNSHFADEAYRRAQKQHQQLNPLLPRAWQEKSMSQKAVGLLRSLDGVDCVLVGMRQASYVDDVLEALRGPGLDDARRVWGGLPGHLV